MKKAPLLVISLLAVTPAFSQDGPRYFDNFDTARGVQVTLPQPVAVPVKPKPGAKSTNKKLVQKTAAVTPKLPIVRSMGVTEGLADATLAGAGAPKPTMTSNAGLKGFTTGNPLHDTFIVDSSRRYNIDPLLIYAQMHQESSFKLKAMSHKGASGLMQLMPATARRLGVANIFDPKQNIDGGVKYMRMLLDMFGQDVVLALAGYNAGEGAVMRYGNNVPPYNETREYVRRITARYNSITDGTFAANYRRVSGAQAAKLEKKESRPLTIYEPDAVAIRLPDGTMRLVNQ
jgi:Transglycosylase SLT domain